MIQVYEQFPPDSLLEELSKRKAHLSRLIQIKIKALKEAPEGALRISSSKGTVQYYHITKEQPDKKIYIPKSQTDLIHALAQKDYNSKILPKLQEELETVENALSTLSKSNTAGFIEKISKKRRKFIEPITLSDDEYVSRWLKTEYKHKKFEDDAPQLFTSKGEQVRSKSEIIIAEALTKAEIPYHYEYPLKLSAFNVHPDFLCLNVRNRKEFAWEHFGMMDNPEYANQAAKKIACYQKNGWFLGTNLIITMETKERPLNPNDVREIISHYLK